MQKLKLPSVLLLILFSCNVPNANQSPATPEKPNHHPVVEFVINFVAAHKNWNQNSVIKDQTDNIFKDSVLSMYQRPNIFSDYKFKCKKIGKYGETGEKPKYFAIFENDNDSSIEHSTIYLQLLAKISDSTMATLAEESYYKIKSYSYLDYAKSQTIAFDSLSYRNNYYLGAANIDIKSVVPW